MKISELFSGSTETNGAKKYVPMGLITVYDSPKPTITARKVTIRQERNSRRCSVNAWDSKLSVVLSSVISHYLVDFYINILLSIIDSCSNEIKISSSPLTPSFEQ